MVGALYSGTAHARPLKGPGMMTPSDLEYFVTFSASVFLFSEQNCREYFWEKVRESHYSSLPRMMPSFCMRDQVSSRCVKGV
jgi:hypothetical protein